MKSIFYCINDILGVLFNKTCSFRDLFKLQCPPLKYSLQTTKRTTNREPTLRDLMSTLYLTTDKVDELEYHPISFGEGLMSSLGYFMGKTQTFERKPSSNGIAIVFILGGVTGKEIKCLTDICGALNKKNQRMVLCSTRISTPAKTMSSIIEPVHLY